MKKETSGTVIIFAVIFLLATFGSPFLVIAALGGGLIVQLLILSIPLVLAFLLFWANASLLTRSTRTRSRRELLLYPLLIISLIVAILSFAELYLF